MQQGLGYNPNAMRSGGTPKGPTVRSGRIAANTPSSALKAVHTVNFDGDTWLAVQYKGDLKEEWKHNYEFRLSRSFPPKANTMDNIACGNWDGTWSEFS